MGEWGAFAYMVSRATLYRGGRSEVLWRLFDFWQKARPPGVTDALLARREAFLRRELRRLSRICRPHDDSGVRLCTWTQERTLIKRKLGTPDGGMGSGIWYGIYYVRDGLVCVGGGRVRLQQPGAAQPKTLRQWLDTSPGSSSRLTETQATK